MYLNCVDGNMATTINGDRKPIDQWMNARKNTSQVIYCKYEDCDNTTFQMWTDGYIQCTHCGGGVRE